MLSELSSSGYRKVKFQYFLTQIRIKIAGRVGAESNQNNKIQKSTFFWGVGGVGGLGGIWENS
jgi:hypothetical protein